MAESDTELIRRTQRGHRQAFDELVRRHQDRIFHAVYRFCANWEDACDITQRAFVNAYRSIDRFQGDSSFSTWMYRIAFNQSVSFRRETGRRRVASLSGSDEEKNHDPADLHAPSDRMESEDNQRKVQQALSRLAEDDRKIIVLKDLMDHSYEEIAGILEIPKGTVRSRLHRARGALKEILKSFAGTFP